MGLGLVKSLVNDKMQAFCAIDVKDELLCWGVNVLYPPANLGPVKAISMYVDRYCAINQFDQVNYWGPNSTAFPLRKELELAKSISVNSGNVCATTLEDRTFCDFGPLIVELTIDYDKSAQLAASDNGTCAIGEDQQLRCYDWDSGWFRTVL